MVSERPGVLNILITSGFWRRLISLVRYFFLTEDKKVNVDIKAIAVRGELASKL